MEVLKGIIGSVQSLDTPVLIKIRQICLRVRNIAATFGERRSAIYDRMVSLYECYYYNCFKEFANVLLYV